MSIVPSIYPPWDAALVHLDLTQNTWWQGAGMNNHLLLFQAGRLLHSLENTQILVHWRNLKVFEVFLKLGFTWHWSFTFTNLPIAKIWFVAEAPPPPKPDAWRVWCLGGTSERLRSLGWMVSSSAPISLPNSWAAWFLGKIPNFWLSRKQQGMVERRQGDLGPVKWCLLNIPPNYLQLK